MLFRSKVVSAPTQIGDANTQTNTAETASIQAQAKAYDDLRTEINDILGTRDANIKRMVEEMNAIRVPFQVLATLHLQFPLIHLFLIP